MTVLGCSLKKHIANSKRGCERSEHPSSVYFWSIQIFFNFATSIFLWSKKQMRMQAKQASEFCLFLKHANIFQSSILQLSKHQSEATIWGMFISEAYKYFSTSIFFWSKKQTSIRVPFISEAYKYFQFCNFNICLEQKANEDASETSIWVPFISEGYKYFSILQLQYLFGALSNQNLEA